MVTRFDRRGRIIVPHVFQEVVALRLGQGANPASVTERRREPRVPVLTGTIMIPCCARLGRKQMSVEVHDLSDHGIGIIMKGPPLHAKDQFILPLLGSPGCSSKAALFETTHWRPMSEEWFSIGARFLREVQALAVRDLLGGGSQTAVERPLGVDRVAEALLIRAMHEPSTKEQQRIREVEERLAQL